MKNIPDSILSKVGKNLHNKKNHPLNILKNKIIDNLNPDYVFDNLSPWVTVENNFDKLLIPKDHISRSLSDSYYKDDNILLRTHTSAHQYPLLKDGYADFVVVGDVYRRDEIDKYHYPVFHQMEIVKIIPDSFTDEVVSILKGNIKDLLVELFGKTPLRFVDSYFPFTEPSFEVEIEYNGRWLEVLGCGVIKNEILYGTKYQTEYGYAIGLGLERLAMILFDIPDIRYFWSEDERFLNQFDSGEIVKFKQYSKYPSCYKDISFWITEDFKLNDFMEIIRNVAEDLVEEVILLDKFESKGRTSHCYRILYRHMDRSLTNEEVDILNIKMREQVKEKLNVNLR